MAASKGFAVKRLSLTPSTTLGGGGRKERKEEEGGRNEEEREGGRAQCRAFSCAHKAFRVLYSKRVEKKNTQYPHAKGKTHLTPTPFKPISNNSKEQQSSHSTVLLKLVCPQATVLSSCAWVASIFYSFILKVIGGFKSQGQ